MSDDDSELRDRDAYSVPDDSLYAPKMPGMTVACYVLAGLSAFGGLYLAPETYAALGEMASLWTFVVAFASPLVATVVLATLGSIAEDAHVARRLLEAARD